MLASRNEHIKTTIKNAIKKKQILICDRFVDSTYAYQIVGKKIKKSVNEINKKYILGKLKPDMTIVLKANMKTVFSRLKKRKNKNKFDKLNESFYTKIQRTFIKKSNNKNYYLFDTSNNDSIIENNILKLVLKRLNN